MPCQLSEEITGVTDDVFSYMCNLAMEKCSRKTEKKKASCGGAAMRKRLLIKNFVSQMLAQDRQSRETAMSTTTTNSSKAQQSIGSSNASDLEKDGMEVDDEDDESEVEDEQEQEGSEEEEEDDELDVSTLDEDVDGDEQNSGMGKEEEDETGVASILSSAESAIVAGDAKQQQDMEEDNNNNIGINFVSDAMAQKSATLDDDYHRVPGRDRTLDSDESLFHEDEELELRRELPAVDEHSGWHFYRLNTNEVQRIDDFPENFLDDTKDKLYLMDKSDIQQEEQHQFIGLVNMVPSGALFGDDNSNDVFLPQQLTNLDAMGKEDEDGPPVSRKRPWSMVFAADEEMASLVPASNEGTAAGDSAASLLSPLCCGMLQFGLGEADSGDGIGVNLGQPMMKRVKL